MCPLSGKPENNMWSTLMLNSQTCLLLQRLDCALSSLSLVYAPSKYHPSLQMAPELTALEKGEFLNSVLLPNLVYPTPNYLLHLPYPLIPNCSWILCLSHLRKWRGFWQTSSDYVTGAGRFTADVP